MELHLSGIFTYPDKCLETNSPFQKKDGSLIPKFSYPDSQHGNRGVRISEAPPYIKFISIKFAL